VDWKEKLKLYDIHSNEYVVSIFLIVLGNSRYKYIELTFDQTQPTLFKCLINAFRYFGGRTEEILFDNMRTIVDQVKSNFSDVVINSKAMQFSKDAGFKIVTCRPYRLKTKGKVETLAKIMNRLKTYDYEFSDIEELEQIVKTLNYELNYVEKSQATNEIPKVLFDKEKEYLLPVNYDVLETYIKPTKTYKVSKESMITYKGIKYSVPIHLIGKDITVLDEDNNIHLYYNSKLINTYQKNNFKYNYKRDDYIDILKHSSFNNKTEEIKFGNTHQRNKDAKLFKFTGCNDCNYSYKCKEKMKVENKNKDYRTIELIPDYELLKEQVRNNLLSPKGIEIRVNRNIQVEGTFGQIKNNMGYIRIRRRGIKKVSCQIMLMCLGRNIRKYFTTLEGNEVKSNYWNTPKNLKTERIPFLKQKRKRLLEINYLIS